MSGWVKVQNTMPTHPKFLTAGTDASWLFVCGLCYSNEHLTDGFIPQYVLPAVAPGTPKIQAAARRLVSVGLWHEIDGGWLIHDYEEHQRTAEQVRERRSWDAKRKSFFRDHELVAAIRARDGDNCRYCGREVNWKNRRGSEGGTYDHVKPRGGNTFENIVVCCKGCNSRKGARPAEAVGMALLPPPGSSSDLDRSQIGSRSELAPGTRSELARGSSSDLARRRVNRKESQLRVAGDRDD